MDKKRELYKRYLDEKHVMDMLSKIIVSLYELQEKPEDPLQYIQDFLGSTGGVDMPAIRAENAKMQKKIDELKEQLEKLNAKKEEPKT